MENLLYQVLRTSTSTVATAKYCAYSGGMQDADYLQEGARALPGSAQGASGQGG